MPFVPYRCPKGGFHKFNKTKLVQEKKPFRPASIRRVRVCSKCGRQGRTLKE